MCCNSPVAITSCGVIASGHFHLQFMGLKQVSNWTGSHLELHWQASPSHWLVAHPTRIWTLATQRQETQRSRRGIVYQSGRLSSTQMADMSSVDRARRWRRGRFRPISIRQSLPTRFGPWRSRLDMTRRGIRRTLFGFLDGNWSEDRRISALPKFEHMCRGESC